MMKRLSLAVALIAASVASAEDIDLFDTSHMAIPMDSPPRIALQKAVLTCVLDSVEAGVWQDCVGQGTAACIAEATGTLLGSDLGDGLTAACQLTEATTWESLFFFTSSGIVSDPGQGADPEPPEDVMAKLAAFAAFNNATQAECGSAPTVADLMGTATPESSLCWSTALSTEVFSLMMSERPL